MKNLPAVWKTWVQSLGWEDSLEKEKAAHCSILAWGIPRTGIVQGVTKKLDTTEQLSLSRLSFMEEYPLPLVLTERN